MAFPKWLHERLMTPILRPVTDEDRERWAQEDQERKRDSQAKLRAARRAEAEALSDLLAEDTADDDLPG